MKPTLQQFKEWICLQFGHFPNIKTSWHFDSYDRANCRCCGKVVTKFYGEWE